MENQERNNIDPNIWGPFFWRTIDFVIMGFGFQLTDDDKKYFAQFFGSMVHNLPCH